MQPAAEDFDAIFVARFHDDGCTAILIVAGGDEFLPLDVFPMAGGDDDGLALADIMSGFDEHFFLTDEVMMMLADFDIL